MKSGMSADETYQVPTQANVTHSLKLARVARPRGHFLRVITHSRDLFPRETRPLQLE